MARIPDQAPMSPLSRERRRPVVAETGDLGLGAVAEGLQTVAAAKQETARVKAETAYGGLSTTYSETFRPAAEAYDGRKPGFAREQIGVYDGLAEQTRAQLDPDAQAAFDTLNQDGRLRAVDHATAVEARAAAGRLQQQRQTQVKLSAIETAATVRVAYLKEAEEAWRGLDPSDPGAVARILSIWDRHAAAAIEGVEDEDTRQAIQLSLANDRASEALRLTSAEQSLQDARLLTSVTTTVDALNQVVLTDPSQYEEARKKGLAALAPLGPDLEAKLAPKIEDALATALLSAMYLKRDYKGVVDLIESGTLRGRASADTVGQFLARAQGDLHGEGQQLARVTLENRLAAEVTSLASTGVSTGLDPAEFEALGPAAVAEARGKIRQARLVYDATRGLAGMTPADQAARLETLKPKPGDPDFANKQAAYQAGLERLTAARALQQTDPALAVQDAPESAALWRAAAAGGPAEAQAWAADAMTRQERLGIAPALRRVLPVAEAQRLAKLGETAEPQNRAAVLSEIYSYAARFGPHGGKVLNEITRAGLDPIDAAVLNATDAHPVALAQYARARASPLAAKISDGEKEDVQERIARELKPLTDSYAAQPGGAVLADGLAQAVLIVAKANVAEGLSPKDAVRKAAAPYLDRYAFVSGWRVPASIVAGEVEGVLRSGARAKPTPARKALEDGAHRLLRDFALTQGGKPPPLYPRGPEPHLTKAQKQQRYGNLVAEQGRWVTTSDEGGLVLMIPDPRGGLTPVFDEDGRPIVRTWAQILDRVRRP